MVFDFVGCIPILQTCFGDEPELSYFREQALGVVRENVSVCVDWAGWRLC